MSHPHSGNSYMINNHRITLTTEPFIFHSWGQTLSLVVFILKFKKTSMNEQPLIDDILQQGRKCMYIIEELFYLVHNLWFIVLYIFIVMPINHYSSRKCIFLISNIMAGTKSSIRRYMQMYQIHFLGWRLPQIAKFIGPTWGPSGSCRPQMGPMLAQWTLISGYT